MMPKLKGSHPWALILCDANDQAVPDWPALDYFKALIADPNGNGLYTWWQQISGGNLDLAGSKVFGWYQLPNSVAEIAKMDRAGADRRGPQRSYGEGRRPFSLSSYLVDHHWRGRWQHRVRRRYSH